MSERRPFAAPKTALIYLIGASLLGGVLIWGGFMQRLFGVYFSLGDLTPIIDWVSGMALSALDLGWPMIVLGSTLIGSAVGVSIGRKWAWQMALFASALAVLYAWPGTVVGLIGLSLLLTPSVREFCVE